MTGSSIEVVEIEATHALYETALDLRYSVFFEPYGLAKDVTPDEMEATSSHFVITEAEQLVAYGRLSPLDEDAFRISQIVVLPEKQGQGLSRILVLHLTAQAKSRGAKTIRLGAQVEAQGLYEKLGFAPIGEEYTVELTGVRHIRMAFQVEDAPNA